MYNNLNYKNLNIYEKDYNKEINNNFQVYYEFLASYYNLNKFDKI